MLLIFKIDYKPTSVNKEICNYLIIACQLFDATISGQNWRNLLCLIGSTATNSPNLPARLVGDFF
jgi:hypothetical protein